VLSHAVELELDRGLDPRAGRVAIRAPSAWGWPEGSITCDFKTASARGGEGDPRRPGATVSIQEVAESVGYQTASAFAVAFRRWCGVTPSEARRAASAAQKLMLRGAQGAELQIQVDSDLRLPSGASANGLSQKRTVLSLDPTDIGARPQRIVHARLESFKLL